MKLNHSEKNYNRLAEKYHLDMYKDNGRYTVFDSKNNRILLDNLPSEETAINETIDVFNYNISRRQTDKNNMFSYY